jgi:hypothetical protein
VNLDWVRFASPGHLLLPSGQEEKREKEKQEGGRQQAERTSVTARGGGRGDGALFGDRLHGVATQ